MKVTVPWLEDVGKGVGISDLGISSLCARTISMVRLTLACVLLKFNKRVARSELKEMFSRVWMAESGFGPRDWVGPGRKVLALKCFWKIWMVLM